MTAATTNAGPTADRPMGDPAAAAAGIRQFATMSELRDYWDDWLETGSRVPVRVLDWLGRCWTLLEDYTGEPGITRAGEYEEYASEQEPALVCVEELPEVAFPVALLVHPAHESAILSELGQARQRAVLESHTAAMR
jgi:hypothetical protein